MFGILIREKGVGNKKNIGDYVESIAQRQFLPNEDNCYVDIETLSSFITLPSVIKSEFGSRLLVVSVFNISLILFALIFIALQHNNVVINIPLNILNIFTSIKS